MINLLVQIKLIICVFRVKSFAEIIKFIEKIYLALQKRQDN